MTAEFAVVTPVVALLVAVVVASAAAGITKLRCLDAARAAARLAARHEPESISLAAARSAGPNGAQIQLSRTGDLVRVRVTARLRLPLPGRPTIELEGLASALVEPVWSEDLAGEGLANASEGLANGLTNEGLTNEGEGLAIEGEGLASEGLAIEGEGLASEGLAIGGDGRASEGFTNEGEGLAPGGGPEAEGESR